MVSGKTEQKNFGVKKFIPPKTLKFFKVIINKISKVYTACK